MPGAAWGAEKTRPSRAPDFTSGFHRNSCCPVTCVFLFHVMVLSFGFCLFLVLLRGIPLYFAYRDVAVYA